MGATLTSEKVHEILGHIAVGGEDLADARGPLGPRPAWGALHRVGHPLEQTLTCETQSVVGTGSRGHWPLFEVRAQGPLTTSAVLTLMQQRGKSPATFVSPVDGQVSTSKGLYHRPFTTGEPQGERA